MVCRVLSNEFTIQLYLFEMIDEMVDRRGSLFSDRAIHRRGIRATVSKGLTIVYGSPRVKVDRVRSGLRLVKNRTATGISFDQDWVGVGVGISKGRGRY